jgi:hypothetical protein
MKAWASYSVNQRAIARARELIESRQYVVTCLRPRAITLDRRVRTTPLWCADPSSLLDKLDDHRLAGR